jgi:hypothetical protein
MPFIEAERVVCQILDRMGVQHLHAYSWPDGSLYRYVRTKWTKEEFLSGGMCDDVRKLIHDGT